MKNRILLFILSIALFAGCKDEKSKEVTAAEPSKQVKVTLMASVKTADDFQLFFKEEDNLAAPFEEGNSVWQKVSPSETPQEIVFLLPEKVLPNYLRLDVGKNDKQEGITISNFKIEYLQKKIEASPAAFLEVYFVPNNSIAIEDKATGAVKTKKDENGIYDPVFNSGENLKGELQKIYR